MPSDKPNIIMIMTDQQRFDTIGALGYDYMVTPNLDRLARKGVVFRQAYAAAATCMSSRAALFTGMYAHTTGVYGFNIWNKHACWVEELNRAGYWCASIGKMHLGTRVPDAGFHERLIVENPTENPRAQGRPETDWGKYLELHGTNPPIDRHLTDPDWYDKHQGVPWHMEEHLHSDVFVGNSALAWIRNFTQDRPIFLQIGFTGPHDPYDPLPRHLDLYDDKEIPGPNRKEGELDEKPLQHKAFQHGFAQGTNESAIRIANASEDDIKKMRKHYFAKITTVDEKIGQILDALEDRGYLENALVLFMSDHGDQLGDHWLPYKWLMYDTTVHVPLVIWDTRANKHAMIDDLVSLVDVGPTVLEAVGLERPTYLDGESLMSYQTGDGTGGKEYVFAEDNYLTMVRSKAHKLVHYIGQEEGELYDLVSDPLELHNLWSDPTHQDVKERLTRVMMDWMMESLYKTGGYRSNRDRFSDPVHPRHGPYLNNGHRRQGFKLDDPRWK